MNRCFFHHRRRDRQGMVLLEVVMAMVIFCLVAFSLVEALDSAFDAENNRTKIDAAIRGLNNQLALLNASRVLTGDHDQPDDGSGLLYHISVSQETMQDQKQIPVQSMFRVTITATWKSNGETESRDVSELIYQP